MPNISTTIRSNSNKTEIPPLSVYQPKFRSVEEIIKSRPSYGQLEKEVFRLINRLRNDPVWFIQILFSIRHLYSKGAFLNQDLKIKFATVEGG